MGEITKKVQERWLKWSGHVMRREEDCVGRRAMGLGSVGEEREEGLTEDGWTV